MKKVNAILLLLALTSMSTNAADIYVSAAYTNTDANGSKAKPYKELHTALSVADANDVIHMAEGKYLPQTDAVNGERYSTFVINKNMQIKGGYSADFETDEPENYPTILSGDLDGNDFYDPVLGIASSNENNSYHVITVNEGATLSLEGLTIQGGNANLNDVAGKPKSQNGGGIFSLGALKLENVIVTGNSNAGKPGAGIYSNANIEANKVSFLGNKSGNDGGGLYVKNGIATVTNCMFVGNEADSGGGAMMIGGTTGTYIANNTFYWNTTSRYGTCSLYGAGNETTVVLVNNTFVNNDISSATNKNNGGGGAVYVNWGGNVYLVNNTILGNKTLDGTDTGEGGAVYSRAGNLFLANNVIAGNFAPDGEDIYHNGGEQQITSLGYNVYTYGGVVSAFIDPDKDITLGTNKATGLALLAQIFDGNATAYVFEAEATNNGGTTETVKINDATVSIATGKTIACLPATQLSEATLNTDLNNDGDLEDVLNTDQRGENRNLTGKACIGAYDYYSIETGANPVSVSGRHILSLYNKQLHVNGTADFVCTVYDVSGKKQIEKRQKGSFNLNLSSLPQGVYIVRVNYPGAETVRKIIL
ncbi:MAG: T9SS type A sorting domain-containing protein [Dysgonamonadaceae bacterium]|nr:T9SS type A sorting domain-containing protein [Dysgonamonadaceae bacterium]